MSFLGKKWEIKYTEKQGDLIDKLLKNRGLENQETMYSFFNYNLSRLHDPFLLKDMQKAVDRLKQAIENEEKIMIFGDYDVDGTSATALLYDLFQKIGANIHYRLPHRENDGYGLKDYFIREFKEQGVGVIITVDCGTANKNEVALANELGMTVIITDHHDAPSELPEAYALINAKQPECNYPNKELSGSAVAYKLVCALAPLYFDPQTTERYLYDQMGLAVLGLVADCMALTGENRVLTNNGLKSLNEGRHIGIQALLKSGGIENQPITSQTIGFFIGPHINAAGRLGTADDALELLLGDIRKAPILVELNQQRKDIVREALQDAIDQVEAMEELPHILVLRSRRWNAGILGLIAGRLVEKFNRPAIAMQEKDSELVASCRSLNDFDITAFLREIGEELFINVGGHMLAGGFTLPTSNREELEKRIRDNAPKYIDLNHFHGQLEVECEIHPHEINIETQVKLSKFEPFGMGNPQPTLMIRSVQIDEVTPLGKTQEHLKFPVQLGPQTFEAIAFRFGEHLAKITPEKNYDIAFNLEINEWRGRRKVQLRVVDMKEAESE